MKNLPLSYFKRMSFLFILVFLMLSLIVPAAVFANQPQNPVSAYTTVSGPDNWTGAINITGGPIDLRSGEITIKGSDIIVEAVNHNADWYGTNVGFLGGVTEGTGVWNFDGTTITIKGGANGSVERHLALMFENNTLNLTNTAITIENNVKSHPFLWAASSASGEGKLNISGLTLTSNTEEQSVLLRTGGKPGSGNDNFSGGTITLSGVNSFNTVKGAIRNQGTFKITDGTTTFDQSEIELRKGGIIIDEGSLVFDGTTLSLNTDIAAATPVLTVKDGARLEFKNSSKFDLANLPANTPAILVEKGGILVVDGSEITGANGSNDRAFIIAEGGEIQITNNANIHDNKNTSQSGNLIRITEGALTISANTRIANNSVLVNVDTSGKDFPTRRGGVIYTEKAEVLIDQAVFTGNSSIWCGAIALFESKSAVISNSTFTGNQQTNSEFTWTGGAAIYAKDTNLVLNGGNTFSGNEAVHGAGIRIYKGSLTVNAGSTFSNNKARWSGGAIHGMDTDITIMGGTFTDNRGDQYGGAIDHQGGSLILGTNDSTNSENSSELRFTGNTAGLIGGAVSVEIDIRNVAEGAAEAFIDMGLTINNAYFENNHTTAQGGALGVGYSAETIEYRDALQAVIHKAVFKENYATQDYMEVGGGAIFISNDGHLKMGKAAIVNNSTKASGGAIASCHNGETNIDGAVIFSNSADFPPEGFKDIYLMYDETYGLKYNITEKMFNGGEHHWQTSDPVDAKAVHTYYDEQSGWYKTEMIDVKGIYLGSNPSNTDYTDADVLFVDNYSWPHDTQYPEIKQYQANGGAIGNNGILDIKADAPTPEPEPPTPPEPEWPHFFRLHELPKTGFSTVHPTVLSAQPKEISYKPENIVLQIPSLDLKADIVSVPYADGEYPVEWLDMQVGMLEGSAKPGEGYTVLTGHNTLNSTEVGPFAFLSFLEEGDMIFLLNRYNELKPYTVYAVEKISATDSASLERIACMNKNSLTMITCEDELPEGGYASRRLVAAKPVGTW